MSYQIQYSPEFAKQYPSKPKQKRSPLPLVAISAALLLVYIAVKTNIFSILLPGDEAVTVAAFSSLVESVESGIPVRSSLLEFCRKIIVNGA